MQLSLWICETFMTPKCWLPKVSASSGLVARGPRTRPYQLTCQRCLPDRSEVLPTKCASFQNMRQRSRQSGEWPLSQCRKAKIINLRFELGAASWRNDPGIKLQVSSDKEEQWFHHRKFIRVAVLKSLPRLDTMRDCGLGPENGSRNHTGNLWSRSLVVLLGGVK